jgi:hypothetical protein
VIAKLVRFLAGKKTYLVCFAGIVYGWGVHKRWWPNENEVWASLGFTGAATLRAAIAKLFRLIQEDSLKAPQPGRHIQP